MIDVVIFDLDGTLADTWEDIAWCANRSLEAVGRPPLEPEAIRRFIGGGVPKLMKALFNLDAPGEPGHAETGGPTSIITDVQELAINQELNRAIETFRGLYQKHCIERTHLFPGIEEALDRLAGGTTLAVATNKPAKYTLQILRGLGVLDSFASVQCGDIAERQKPEPAMIEAVLEETGHPAKRALMVGDSEIDFQAAHAAGVRVCAVAWGYGDAGALAALKPEFIINAPAELVGMVHGEGGR